MPSIDALRLVAVKYAFIDVKLFASVVFFTVSPLKFADWDISIELVHLHATHSDTD